MTSSVIVTGASAGLGEAAARRLAETGHHVILACRSVPRGEAAAERIRAAVPAAGLEVLRVDLARLASVRRAAAEVLAGADRRPPLRVLVCNAGVQVVDGVRRSADGHELTFATNHLGHFLLLRSLSEGMAAPGRIVLVSSGVHLGPRRSMGFPAPRWEHPRALADPDASALDASAHAGRVRYATSKLANIYLAYEAARRLADRGITVNAFDPGLMPETGLDRDWPRAVQRVYHGLAPVLLRTLPMARTVDRSGADLAWLATSPQVAEVTGAYFSGRRARASSPESHDAARAAELWEVSEQLVTAG